MTSTPGTTPVPPTTTDTTTGTTTDTATGSATGTATGPARIVVGVDGSEPAAAALAWALDEGALRHAPVHVVLTWSLPPVVGMSPMMPAEADLQIGAQQELDAMLKGLSDSLDRRPEDSPVTSEVLEGSPAPTLLTASRGATMLVLGSRGHGGFAGLLLGSVSQHCAAHASCPVVVVRGTAAAH